MRMLDMNMLRLFQNKKSLKTLSEMNMKLRTNIYECNVKALLKSDPNKSMS